MESSASSSADTQPLWSPSHPERAQSTLFRNHINSKYSLSLSSYEELWRWSCDHRADFWSEVWDWEQVIGSKGSEPYTDESVPPSSNPLWFPGASFNWAENQLRNIAHPDDVAIITLSEPCPGHTPEARKVTQKELYELVREAQKAMRAHGVTKGDRVAFWGGTCLEAVVVLLAVTSLGGVFSSAAADFGVDGVVERLEQIRPKLLFVTNGVVYGAAPRPLLPLIPKLHSSLSQPPKETIVIDHLPHGICKKPAELDSSTLPWTDFIQDSEEGSDSGKIEFVQTGFNDPIWVLFSSGTTGKPKAIVHRAGGMLIDSLREHHLQGDITRGDVYFYYTTPGWMMFQYLISGLATGATLVLYEGSPLKRAAALWEMVDELGITIFGTSAKWLEVISKTYPNVKENHSLSTLRQILSTGSPLPPALFDFVYSNVKSAVLLGSITGGSDICSVFAGRNTALPVYRGEIQSRMLGFDLDVEGAGPGTPGELICHKAFPIEPLGFWPLPGYGFDEQAVADAQKRFRESYFKNEQGTWYHGDYVQITPSRSGNGGGVVMLGRSDGVLNPGGIRFGPTDIYSVLESNDFASQGVEDCLVVGLMVEGGADEKVILFVKMAQGKALDDDLTKKIKTAIRLARSARHVPAKILAVSDVPVTLTGKRVEVPIRKVINGSPISSINPATLRNPECLEEYANFGATMREEEGMA
ncbi:hypothetical protein BD324DRAFT_577506 [Kockovaella imperatae]|uniref:AMP-dependent synthetase/ligase domain-containing protein n=1 Tax=Kockovaella imperatae TaxID=4999 RepID=A0A1Y1UMG9_9TREE|nr:hypothetical protein BD324DRAFT_577506 [Kockovaella imperatae]ORX38666.1 hypothetical protein BD324DRAFT_577506 [Kockovaella imperatae]